MKIFIAVIGRSNRECRCALVKDDVITLNKLLEEYSVVAYEIQSVTNVNAFGAIYKREVKVKYSPDFEEKIAKYSKLDQSILKSVLDLAQKSGNPDILTSALKISLIDVIEFTRNT